MFQESKNVLVVEGHAELRESIVTILDFLGHVVTSAENFPDAIRVFELKTSIDVVIVSYGLPPHVGLVFAKKIRIINPGAKVILISSYVPPLDRLEVDEFLQKPFTMNQLQTAVTG